MIRLRAGALVALACAGCDGSGSSSATPSTSISAPPKATVAPAVTEETKAALANLATEYRGTVGSLAVVARLRHDDNRVSGSYFTEGAGTSLLLAGVATGPHLVLEETVGKTKTGSLALDVGSDGVLAGTWTDAHGDKPSPVHLEAIVPVARPTKALLFKRVAHASRAARDQKSAGDACTSTLTYAEAYGLPSTIEAKLNADLGPASDLTPDRCDRALEISADYRVAYNADGLLSVRITDAVTDSSTGAATTTHKGRVVSVVLASGVPVKLFGDVVKPKAERTFESALNQQIEAATRKHHLDAEGRKLLDGALAFSPPFVLEDAGVRLFPDSLAATYAAVTAEGVLVRYAILPRPVGPVAVLWK